jgi:hypothetical protein
MVLTLPLCVLYGSHNEQLLSSHTTLAKCFCITEIESVYCAVRTESQYKTNTLCLQKAKEKYKDKKEIEKSTEFFLAGMKAQ